MSDRPETAYVISFDEQAPERLKPMLEQWGCRVEWIPAVRGSEVASAELNSKSIAHLTGREVTPGMVGCAASHRVAYEALLSGSQAWALVLEDDAEVASLEQPPPKLEDLCSGLSSEPTIIQLATRGSRFLRKGCSFDRFGQFTRFSFGYPPGQTLSYLVNQEAARLLLSRHIDGPADWPSAAAHIKFLGVYPWLFRESGRPSTIEDQSAMSLRWRIAQVTGLNALFARRHGVSPREAWRVSTAPYLASFWSRRLWSEAPLGPDGPKVPFARPRLRRSTRR